MDSSKLKMYILIHEDVDVGHAVNCAAHASLQMYKAFKHDVIVEDWIAYSFRKVSCKVTDKEFQKAKTYGDFVIVTESALNQKEVALAFKPREEWPEFFKSLKLYK